MEIALKMFVIGFITISIIYLSILGRTYIKKLEKQFKNKQND
jgi:hypothetical protein